MIRVLYGNEAFFIQLKRKEFKGLCKECPDFSSLEEVANYFCQLSLFDDDVKYASITLNSFKELAESGCFTSLLKGELFVEIKKPDERQKAFKLLKERKGVKLFLSNKAADIKTAASNLIQAAQLNAISLPYEIATDIVARTDYFENPDISLITLDNYVKQLSCIGMKAENVVKVVPDLREGNAFQLSKLLVGGDVEKVQEELNRTTDSALKLLGLLHWELRPAYLNAVGIPYSESHGKAGVFSKYPKEVLLSCMGVVSDMQQCIKKGVFTEAVALDICCKQIMQILKS